MTIYGPNIYDKKSQKQSPFPRLTKVCPEGDDSCNIEENRIARSETDRIYVVYEITVGEANVLSRNDDENDNTDVNKVLNYLRDALRQAELNDNEFIKSSNYDEIEQELVITDFNDVTKCATTTSIADISSEQVTEILSQCRSDTDCGNTCDLEVEEIEDIRDSIEDLKDRVEGGEEVDDVIINEAANQLEDLSRATTSNNLEDSEETVAEAQKFFEELLIVAEPGLNLTSRDGLVAIQTFAEDDKVTAPVIPGVTSSNDEYFNYESTITSVDTGLKVVVPASIVEGQDCETPVAFAEMSNANHLKTDDDKWDLGLSSVVVETCNADENTEFSEAVVMQFKADEDKTEGTSVKCAYYDNEMYRWRVDGDAQLQPDGSYLCEVTHLTYFSLLFQEDGDSNDALSIADMVCNIISVICCVITIIYLIIAEPAFWKKLGDKPVKRSYFQLSISLIFINVIFLFGQQFFSPDISNEEACVAVAALQHWAIVSFFLITLNTALILFCAVKRKNIYHFTKWYTKIGALLLPYIISGIVVGICLGVGRSYGKEYFYGGLGESSKTYLRMQQLDSGDLLCFVDGLFFDIGVTLPYALAMATVLVVYAISFKSILNFSQESMAHEKIYMNGKKMFLLFFTIGACWLLLILSMAGVGIGADWTFTIFKALQAVVLMWVVCGDKILKMFRRLTGKAGSMDIRDSQ